MPAIARAEQQLDIIADTALAADPRLTPRCSSTVSDPSDSHRRGRASAMANPETREKARLKRIAVRHASDNAPRYSSTDDEVRAIDRRRGELGLSHEAFCQRAAVSFWTWRDIRRGNFTPSQKMFNRLRGALVEPAIPGPPPAVIKSYHRLVMRMLAQEKGLDPDAVAAVDLSTQRPQVPTWLEAARINNMAIYLTTVELQVENADFARALGISREAVRKARNKVEDLRDDPAIDELLTRVRQQVVG